MNIPLLLLIEFVLVIDLFDCLQHQKKHWEIATFANLLGAFLILFILIGQTIGL